MKMRDYKSNINVEVLRRIKVSVTITLDSKISINLIELVYFLINHRIRAAIIDDYLFPIIDKKSLLESIYYQIGLFDMYDLNWDALQEAFEYFIDDNNCEFVLIFRNGINLQKQLPEEFRVLEEIIKNLNASKKVNNGIVLGEFDCSK